MNLFDSVLQGYPINAMLFWSLPDNTECEGRFYRFIRRFTDYPGANPAHGQRHTNEQVPSAYLPHDTLAVLDGQQRLTAFYIGLMGTVAYRVHGGWHSIERNYPCRSLYICLTDDMPERDDLQMQAKHQLDWIEHEDIDQPPVFSVKTAMDETWMRVGEVMLASALDAKNWSEQQASIACLEAREKGHVWTEYEFKNASDVLLRLHEAIHTERHINFFHLNASVDIGRAMETFVRVNSSGTALDYADLVFSVIGTQWKSRNAKHEFDALESRLGMLKEELSYLQNLRLDKRFILRSAMLCVTEKVLPLELAQMKSDLVQKLEFSWPAITEAIIQACRIVGNRKLYAFHQRELVMVLVLFLFRSNQTGYAIGQHDVVAMEQWLIRATLTWYDAKAAADTRLRSYVNALLDSMAESGPGFPFNRILSKGWANLTVHSDDLPDRMTGIHIGDLLNRSKNECTFLLGLIQTDLEPMTDYNVDHCYPYAEVYTRPEELRGEDHSEYHRCINELANLQMLPESENKSKSNKPFDKWFYSLDAETQSGLKVSHFIPEGHPLPADSDMEREAAFWKFHSARRDLLRTRIQTILAEPQALLS